MDVVLDTFMGLVISRQGLDHTVNIGMDLA